jgi:NAD(P)H-flavin reductase
MQRINLNLNVFYTLTQPTENWTGLAGRISADMIKEEVPDYFERVSYVCGPPGMVDTIMKVLINELKISAPQIRYEHFTGY